MSTNRFQKLTRTDLETLIREKNTKRPVNIYVVEGGFELQKLIQKLKEEQKKNPSKPYSAQVLCKKPDTPHPAAHLLSESEAELMYIRYHHWSALNIYLEEKGGNIFYLDSSMQKVNSQFVMSVAGAEKLQYIQCQSGLQKDGELCSVFSLHYVFQMSKDAKLQEKIVSIRKEIPDTEGTMFEIDPMDLPVEYVKTAQSYTFIDEYTKKHSAETKKINQKGQTLTEYAKSNAVYSEELKKDVNGSVQKKHTKYTARMFSFTEKEDSTSVPKSKDSNDYSITKK